MDTMTKTVIWTDSNLMTHIETFGYQMAEMGRQLSFEQEARNTGDYDGARMYAKRAEMFRVAAKELKTDINAQITLKSNSTANSTKGA